jgi:hypothetical protein
VIRRCARRGAAEAPSRQAGRGTPPVRRARRIPVLALWSQSVAPILHVPRATSEAVQGCRAAPEDDWSCICVSATTHSRAPRRALNGARAHRTSVTRRTSRRHARRATWSS